MSPNTPLTDEQRGAVVKLRAMYSSLESSPPLGTSESVEERARHPDPEALPGDITVRIEIAPPSSQPHPLLDGSILKVPERVPIYFYALGDDRAESNLESASELANTRVIFFIHGGGNRTGHPTHRPFIQLYAQLLRAAASRPTATGTNCVLIAPSYRLATVPENVFPAALQDLVAAYDYVLGKGYDASNIFVAGDSAGGNHAIVLTHLALHANRPAPAGVIAIAPGAIQVFDRVSEHVKAHASKDILEISAYEAVSRLYVGDSGVSLADPLVSGAFISFTESWPRTLILVGTADFVFDACHEVEKRLVALARPVELVEYDERPHGWWVFPHIFLDDIRDAAERIARFIHS